MPRIARIKVKGEPTVYHVMSRTALDGLRLRASTKETFLSLFYGENFTIIRNPKDELKTGTMHAMLDQLGLTRKGRREENRGSQVSKGRRYQPIRNPP